MLLPRPSLPYPTPSPQPTTRTNLQVTTRVSPRPPTSCPNPTSPSGTNSNTKTLRSTKASLGQRRIKNTPNITSSAFPSKNSTGKHNYPTSKSECSLTSKNQASSTQPSTVVTPSKLRRAWGNFLKKLSFDQPAATPSIQILMPICLLQAILVEAIFLEEIPTA